MVRTVAVLQVPYPDEALDPLGETSQLARSDGSDLAHLAPARRTRTCARSAARASKLPGTLACRAPGRSRGRRGMHRSRSAPMANSRSAKRRCGRTRPTHTPAGALCRPISRRYGRVVTRSTGRRRWPGSPGSGSTCARRHLPSTRSVARRQCQSPDSQGAVMRQTRSKIESALLLHGRERRRSGAPSAGLCVHTVPHPRDPTESAVHPRRAPDSPLVVDSLLQRPNSYATACR